LRANRYSLIAVEDLKLKALIEKPGQRPNKHIHDAGWSSFIMMLFSKAEDAGCRVIKVDPRDTTQECSRCGRIVPKILNDRRHNCPNCGLSTDMDLNTAVNILKRALLLLST